MRLTVSEQSPLSIGPRSAEKTLCLDDAQALALVDLGERMGARIVAWNGPRSLRIQQFVGMVRTGDLELEILPKLDGLPEPAQVRKNLLAMLAMTEELEVMASDMLDFLESAEPFICAMARVYCHRLAEAIRRGLRQEYVLHHDLLPNVRGKVHWPTQARLQATGRLELACVFDERSIDTPLNRTLKAALLAAGTMLAGTRTARLVTELRHAMDGVSDNCPPADQRARLRTDRMSRHTEPLLVLARLILGNRSPDPGRFAASRETYALVWDMNRLFEEYVGRIALKMLEPQGFHVMLQEGASTYLAKEGTTRRNAFLLRPDILVLLKEKPWVVADTKWKRLDPRQANLGVSGTDVYQVLAYAHRYDTDLAVLVYPHHPALGSPGPQQELLVRGTSPQPVRVRVLALDLARLEDLPEQLAQGLSR